MISLLSTWDVPTFFTPAVLADFWSANKAWLKFGAPMIMIVFALYYGEELIGMIIGLFTKKKEEADEEDDYEIRRY